MEYNEWADWGQSDWGNGWTNNDPLPQNHNSQQAPKEEGPPRSGEGNLGQSTASGFFDKNRGGSDWFSQAQQNPENRGAPGSGFSYDSNRNSLSQIENREVAPLDNRQSFNSAKPTSLGHFDSRQNRPDQFPPRPQGFQANQSITNVESSNISGYFEPNQDNRIPVGPTKPQFPPPADNFSSQQAGSIRQSGPPPPEGQLGNPQQHFQSHTAPPTLQRPAGGPQGQNANTFQQNPGNNVFGQQAPPKSNSSYPPPNHPNNVPYQRSSSHSLGQRTSNSSGMNPNQSQQNLPFKPPTSNWPNFGEVPPSASQQAHQDNNLQNFFGPPLPPHNQNFDSQPPRQADSLPNGSDGRSGVLQMSSPWEPHLQQPNQLQQPNSPRFQQLPSQPSGHSQSSPGPFIPNSVPSDRSPSAGQTPYFAPKKMTPPSFQQAQAISPPSDQPQVFSGYPPSLEKTSSSSSLELQASGILHQGFPAERPSSAGQFGSNSRKTSFDQHSSDQQPNVAMERPPSAGRHTQNFPNAFPTEPKFSTHPQASSLFPERPPSIGQYQQNSQQALEDQHFDRPSSAGHYLQQDQVFEQVQAHQRLDPSPLDAPNIEQEANAPYQMVPNPQRSSAAIFPEPFAPSGQQHHLPQDEPQAWRSGNGSVGGGSLSPMAEQQQQQASNRRLSPSPHPQNGPHQPPPPQTPRGPVKSLPPPRAASSPLVVPFPPGGYEPPASFPQDVPPENKEFLDNTENIVDDFKALNIQQQKENEPESQQNQQQHCAIDRNQYLETGQFSAQKENSPFLQNIEQNDEGEAPPPGLHRLVTGQGREPVRVDSEQGARASEAEEAASISAVQTRHSTPLSSIGADSEEREEENTKTGRREVPGEAEPLKGRVVVGQVPTPPQDPGSSRSGERQERLERMVVGEHGGEGENVSDDYRQGSRRHHKSRRHRNDSSYEEDEIDYSSDRERRGADRRRGVAPDDRAHRRRREHRSPDFRSDEEYEDRRGYHRSGRESRRRRDYSPDRSYYRDYYRDDEPRHRHYYPRDYDDYYSRGTGGGGGGGGDQRSRPSSRSGSDYRALPMKHQMRGLPGHQYYDPYGPGGGGGGGGGPGYHDYSMKYSQRTIEYFERLRHVDPAGYAAWYSQYMQGRLVQESSRAFSSDRASVHSGQSSSNQRHQGISTPQDELLAREEDEVDYTPRLYDSAHIRGSLDGLGRLVLVEPNYPLDRQPASVSLCRPTQLSLGRDTEEFLQAPGPFIPGITHRNTVLQYLKKMSDRSSGSSERLLYDLVYLTVKGNGEVNGSDVADLLMESYRSRRQTEVTPDPERSQPTTADPGSPAPLSSVEVTATFRALLQQGNKAEALDWAVENGAWGHALFLASKMGEKTHHDIMLRFANGIPHSDPLQTLYQLMSGYVPQAATCCADQKWSDWRPHLAMILSNPTGNGDLDRRAIVTLGDSLNGSGQLFASQFCYLTAQVEFSEFSDPDSKLVLLGSSHHNNADFNKFSSCRAVMLTMCYEYGLKLRQPKFSFPTLRVYKLLLAGRLVDSGRTKSALQYCELLSQEILYGGSPVDRSLLSVVIDMSSRLKMQDPVLAMTGSTDRDPDWLANLKQFYQTFPDEDVGPPQDSSPLKVPEPNPSYSHQEVPYQISDGQMNSLLEPVSIGAPAYPVLGQPQPLAQLQPPVPQPLVAQHQASGFLPVVSQPAAPLLMSSRPQVDDSGYRPGPGFLPAHPSHHLHQQQHQQPPSLGYLPAEIMPTDGPQSAPPNLELQNGAPTESSWEPKFTPVIQASSDQPLTSRNSFFKATEEQLKLNEVGPGGAGDKKRPDDAGKTKAGKAQTAGQSGSGQSEEQSSGWFGGILDKLALRPKNQMRLPDDRNPSIIWDEKKKRWVNLDGDDSEGGASAKPPPKASEALPPQGNKYKIQKGKLMKNNYVDIMGSQQSQREKAENGGGGQALPNTLPPQSRNSFFIPAPVEGIENAPIDFISPAPNNPVLPDSSDMSGKQQGAGGGPPGNQAPQPPRMYNPTRFPS